MTNVTIVVFTYGFHKIFNVTEKTDENELEDLGGYIMDAVRTALNV